jgi:hypothetical protein
VTTLWIAMSLARAEDTSGGATGGPVQAVVWARPFTLAQPERDPNGPGATLGGVAPKTLTEGWLIEVRADPALLRPSQAAEPHLYVGERRAMKLNWDSTGGCLVAIVSGRPDLARTPLLFGAPPRPPADEATVARGEAARLQVQPLGSAVDGAIAAGGAPLAAADLREVYALGMQRVAACTQTPNDLQRAGAR